MQDGGNCRRVGGTAAAGRTRRVTILLHNHQRAARAVENHPIAILVHYLTRVRPARSIRYVREHTETGSKSLSRIAKREWRETLYVIAINSNDLLKCKVVF